MQVAMQMCDADKSFVDHMTNFEFWEAITCQYADPIGFLAFGLLVYSGVALPIYIRTGSATIPGILLLLVGGLVLPQVAGVAQPIVTILVVMLLAGSLAYLYYSYSR